MSKFAYEREIKEYQADEIIECFLGLDKEARSAEREILSAANGKAYSRKGSSMRRIWSKLSDEAKQTINSAYAKDQYPATY